MAKRRDNVSWVNIRGGVKKINKNKRIAVGVKRQEKFTSIVLNCHNSAVFQALTGEKGGWGFGYNNELRLQNF